VNYLAAILITFAIGFTQNVSAEWLSISEIEGGGTAYIETDTIKKADGFIYYWDMQDYLVPVSGFLSSQVYNQADCKRSRVKTLSYVFYKRNMGRGESEQEESENKNWKYPSPGTLMLGILNAACSLSD
jgi:hypothetical protein